MLADGAVFRLMEALLEVGPEGATREHLLRKAKVSTRTFYKYLKDLIRTGIVEESGSKYILPLDLSYNFRFKLWRDLDRLYDQPELVRSAIFNIRDDALLSLRKELLCLWLVGSAARGEMKEGSDLDFLAIVANEADFLPKEGSFEVQWVPMDRQEFLQKLRSGDEFVVAAIRHGLILHDSGIAQPLYSVIPGSPSKEFFQEKELVMERFRSRFFESLSFDELEEARTILSSEAETALRLLLQRLGQRPAGKSELLLLTRIFFGRSVKRDFLSAIWELAPLQKTDLVQLHRKITNYYDGFLSKADHLEYIANTLTRGNQVEFETALLSVLRELLGADQVQGAENAAGVDALTELLERTVLIEVKSLTGTLKNEHLERFASHVRRFERKGKPALGVLMYNILRDVPVLQRPWISYSGKDAGETNVATINSLRILELYLGYQLEGNRDSAVKAFTAEILLSLLGENVIAEDLSERLVEMEAWLSTEEHSDEEVIPDSVQSIEITDMTVVSILEDDSRIEVETSFNFEANIYAEATLIDLDLSALDSERSDYLFLECLKGSVEQDFTDTASATLVFNKQDLSLSSIACKPDRDHLVFERDLFQERVRSKIWHNTRE